MSFLLLRRLLTWPFGEEVLARSPVQGKIEVESGGDLVVPDFPAV